MEHNPTFPQGHGGSRTHIFFPSLAVLISAIGFAGFVFTYFGPILGGTYPPSGFPLHLHGWSFFLYYLLFPAQAVLIATRKYGLHRTVGKLSAVLVLVMTLTGLLVLSVRVEEATRLGGPPVWLRYGPLFLANLVLFVGFYAAAIWMALKNRLEAHKRLIIVASGIGVGAGFARLILVVSNQHPLWTPMGTLGCGLFILIGMVHDWVVHRKVHRAYWLGLVALLVVEGAVLPQINSELVEWINQGLAFIGKYLKVLYQPDPTVEFEASD